MMYIYQCYHGRNIDYTSFVINFTSSYAFGKVCALYMLVLLDINTFSELKMIGSRH